MQYIKGLFINFLVYLDLPVHVDHRDSRVNPEHQVRRDVLEILEFRLIKRVQFIHNESRLHVGPVLKVRQELKDGLVFQVILDLLVQLAIKAMMEMMEHLANRDHKDHQVKISEAPSLKNC